MLELQSFVLLTYFNFSSTEWFYSKQGIFWCSFYVRSCATYLLMLVDDNSGFKIRFNLFGKIENLGLFGQIGILGNDGLWQADRGITMGYGELCGLF